MLRRFLAPWLILALGAGSAMAQTPKAPAGIDLPIDQWLVLGPGLLPSAMLGPDPEACQGVALLTAAPMSLPDTTPRAGATVRWPTGSTLAWSKVEAPDGLLKLALPHGFGVSYAACYLHAPRFERVTLKTKGDGAYQVFVDGETCGKSTTGAELDSPMTLTHGVHRLMIKRVTGPHEASPSAAIQCRIHVEAPFTAQDAPEVTVLPSRPLGIADVRDWPSPSDLAVSPDGSHLAEVVIVPDADHRGWSRDVLVRSTANGALLETLHLGKSQWDPIWSHDGRHLAFTAPGRRDLDLWVYGVADHSLKRIVSGARQLHGALWSRDDRTIYYGTNEPAHVDDDDTLYERLVQLGDRRPDNRDRARLNAVSLDGLVHQQLTFGDTNPSSWDLSPDGKTLALIQSVETSSRPFEREDLVYLDLASLSQRTVMPLPAGTSELSWSPDGSRLAVLSFPAEVSDSEPEHNRAYSTVLLVNPAVKKTLRLFQDVLPVTSHVFWSHSDSSLCMFVAEGAYTRLVRVDPSEPEHLVALGAAEDDLHNLSVSDNGAVAAYVGSSLDEPERVLVRPTRAGSAHVVDVPGSEAMADVKLGKSERWTFKNAHGDTIDGWLLFPPDFDPRGRYPLIVYYYGGALPTTRSFHRERAWLAANGYVVYVLNPSGAYGYGERFADLHVNDWGEIAANDVITGVKTLLSEKPYLDPRRVGNYGGSYGGFMTEDLATKTDLFKASCAMYGISDIASYWGGGFWGYGYGDYALAKSYPWNRPDIYVQRSPLYQADKIKTPLLLLHGTGDTNVPSLESDELFTALKILGKDVAYVRFQNQDHGIRGTPAHRQAVDEIMLEWFDKHLKGQPEGWDARWKDKR